MQHTISNLADRLSPHVVLSHAHTDEKRRIYIVQENKDTKVQLSDLIVDGKLQVYEAVREGDFFTIYRRKDGLVFQAGGYIGLIPINDRVVLDVRPRVPLKNLIRMMRIAEDTPFALDSFLSYYNSRQQRVPSMIDLFADSLISATKEIELNGLHREYLERHNDTSFPRGRILMGESMRRHLARGVRYRAKVSWYEPSVDTAPNRCLKYALWHLANHYRSISQSNRQRLRKLEDTYYLFAGVQLDKSLEFLKATTVKNPETLPAIRAYYRPALYLAQLLIRHHGISFINRKGRIVMPSLLINLKRAFENYLRNALQLRLRELESDVRVLDGNLSGTDGGGKPLFDGSSGPNATPDIVIRRTESDANLPEYPVIADTKYKDFKVPTRSDIEQAVTYAASYRTPSVVIIHPRVEQSVHGLRLLGRIEPFAVYDYAFDLAARNPNLEEAKFADSFRGLLHGPPKRA